MNRYKRLMVPWGKDTPDAKGFFEYAKKHYHDCLKFADDIIPGIPTERETTVRVKLLILDKIASPLVYLYESWEVLSPEEKAKYSPELAKIHEQSKRMAEEAFK